MVTAGLTRLGAAFAAALFPAGAEAACRLALLLALDVSSSVDEAEYILQRDGLAAALMNEDVAGAILQEGGGSVAFAVYEWSGRRQSVVIQDWVLLQSMADIVAVSDRLRTVQRSYRRFPTALGYALGFGATMMGEAPECIRRVIDVSGDGITNDGFWPQLAYRHFPFDGITVNGLAVLGADPDVVDHFEFEVMHGPGAFVETAKGYEGYERAMIRKLYREIQDRVVGALPGEPMGPG
ncbi:DUF1194 domain-containing protein [Mameliella sediminis]|uniref:DUF1194 domain-containing protein n=1 Tax=Mameliella sediminis TaxID=2836866 RepID=UPI001C49267A|nr:DUF1194 domain-containing protein [Mameliella sediminis]MBV7394626.1 DUF1194 domain-containing protein [Mameliella sediminis]MBY6164016.1 DUF1194 domain-containing protein [Mameliella alba]MBY6172488.1 DUF1194 domain-containing protein [Mameliella alba]MBY6177502.1 DUF1194 domain-containing protein [Mameliella alba]